MSAGPWPVEIRSLSAGELAPVLPDLAGLLQDAVAAGASVGFLPPLADTEALTYWQSVADAVQTGSRRLWAAWRGPALAGTVQLGLVTWPNGRHRAEVMKLLVHRAARRQGLGRALMLTVEAAARELGRTTLVLDTLAGEPAELLYASLGWTRAGLIPHYARHTDGQLHPTVVYYKLL
ncbi:MAG: GNAT family N-acetyltransferase [Anaerolineales bacterium]|nr:GNAT family N-acetyltransferase [Anaerolineales bacterium]